MKYPGYERSITTFRRRKPETLDGILYDGSSSCAEWIHDSFAISVVWQDGGDLFIKDGVDREPVRKGDWVLQDENNRVFPAKDADLLAGWEPVSRG